MGKCPGTTLVRNFMLLFSFLFVTRLCFCQCAAVSTEHLQPRMTLFKILYNPTVMLPIVKGEHQSNTS